MNIEAQAKKYGVCDLKYAIRLRDLGELQESLWYWVHHWDRETEGRIWSLFPKDEDDHVNEHISAFTVAKLGERLPRGYRSGRAILHGEEYYTCYGKEGTQTSNTEANARAKMKIYLLENKK